MRNKGRFLALATCSLAVIGAGAGVVEASPSARAEQNTGHYSACLTGDNKLVNVTVSPQHRLDCPSGSDRVTWNAEGPRGRRGHRGDDGARGAQGVPGLPGKNGSTVLNGTGAPGASVGAVGDFYIDTTSWTIYGPKTSNGWPNTGQALRGPQGPAGASGSGGAGGPTVVTGHVNDSTEGSFAACSSPSGLSDALDCSEAPDPAEAVSGLMPVNGGISDFAVQMTDPAATDTEFMLYDLDAESFVTGCTVFADETTCLADQDGFVGGGDRYFLVEFGQPLLVTGPNTLQLTPQLASQGAPLSASFGYTITPNVDAPPVDNTLRISPQLRSSHGWLR